MAFQFYDILYIILTLLGLILGKAAARFLGKRSSLAERGDLLATLETLAELAVSEVERWASDKPDLKGEGKKDEAVKLLVKMLKEHVPSSGLKHLKAQEESLILRAAVEHKVQEKHLREGKGKASGTTIHLNEK